MKLLASWLMVVVVLLGLQLRVVAKDPCEILVLKHQSENCGHQPHDEQSPCDPSHDEGCPLDHHHNCGTCMFHVPLVLENGCKCRLATPSSYRLAVRHERDMIPEGPYLSSEKPPII